MADMWIATGPWDRPKATQPSLMLWFRRGTACRGSEVAGVSDESRPGKTQRIAHRSKADSKTHSFHFPEKMEDTDTVLYDAEADPGQTTPVDDPAVKKRLNDELFRLMAENDAPPEAVKRMKESLCV